MIKTSKNKNCLSMWIIVSIITDLGSGHQSATGTDKEIDANNAIQDMRLSQY